MESYLARVEVDISRGLPGFEMVGLLGSEVKEARERIRVALKNAEVTLPPVRITVNISPASLHKEGTAYDLPVAAGILVALGILPQEYVENTLMAGELGLNGDIKPVRGILPMVLEGKKQGMSRCIIPLENTKEARLVEGIRITGAGNLAALLDSLLQNEGKDGDETEPVCNGNSSAGKRPGLDFGEIRGQESAKRAAVVAAAGFHHLLMIGPPGTGKTMIARSMSSILPPLSKEEQLEVTKVYSVAGMLEEGTGLITDRPFVNPHHTITGHALTGGGRIPRPGVISLAHRGILFLDELTEFRRETLDLLRQPMEEHRVQIARSSGTFSYPADFMLVAAMNPCPCGYYPDRNKCRCTQPQIEKYLGKVSGPLLDRIDLCVELQQVDILHLQTKITGESSEQMRERIERARKMQEKRYAGTEYRFNGDVSSADVDHYCSLGETEKNVMEQLYHALELSARAYHRILKTARTIADLEEQENIAKEHLLEAACYRPSGEYWG